MDAGRSDGAPPADAAAHVDAAARLDAAPRADAAQAADAALVVDAAPVTDAADRADAADEVDAALELDARLELDAALDAALDATPADARPVDAAPDALSVCCATDGGARVVPEPECPFGALRREAVCGPPPSVCCAVPFGVERLAVQACEVPLPETACAADPPVCCRPAEGPARALPAGACDGVAVAWAECLDDEAVCCLSAHARVEPRAAPACTGGDVPVTAGGCFGADVCCDHPDGLLFRPTGLCPRPRPPYACLDADTVCCVLPDGFGERLPPGDCVGRGVAGPGALCDGPEVCCAVDGRHALTPREDCAQPVSILRCTPTPICCLRPDGEAVRLPGVECIGVPTDVAACDRAPGCCVLDDALRVEGDRLACERAAGVAVEPALCAEGAVCCGGPDGPTVAMDCAAPLPDAECALPAPCCALDDGTYAVREDCAVPVTDGLCSQPGLACCDVGLLAGGARVLQALDCFAPGVPLRGPQATRCGEDDIVCCDTGVLGTPIAFLGRPHCASLGGQAVDEGVCRSRGSGP